MRRLEWLAQLYILWHVIKTIKTHGEMLSKETIFQLQKNPAVNGDDGDVIKNISKIYYDNNDTPDETTIETATTYTSTTKNSGNNTAKIFNIFEQIERKEEVHEGDMHFVVQESEEEKHKSQYEVQQSFSILQQLRLDEQQQKWQQEKQQENVIKLQNSKQHLDGESLSKASKKKRKKKRRKRKKKKPVKDKKKKRKKNQQKPINNQTPIIAQPAHILFASPTKKPLHYYQQDDDDHYYASATTKNPLIPIKKIKYILRKNTIFKKKKKEFLNHLKHVLYPFVKFIAFFTIINPFTLAVFLFSLISPIVFGFIGFVGLSFLIKPALNLMFGVKRIVNTIKRRKLQELRRRQRLRDSRRPITIHKHYYQQRPLAPPPAHSHPLALKPKGPFHHPPRLGIRHHHHTGQIKLFNPLLPEVRQILKKDKYIVQNIKGYNDSFEQY